MSARSLALKFGRFKKTCLLALGGGGHLPPPLHPASYGPAVIFYVLLLVILNKNYYQEKLHSKDLFRQLSCHLFPHSGLTGTCSEMLDATYKRRSYEDISSSLKDYCQSKNRQENNLGDAYHRFCLH